MGVIFFIINAAFALILLLMLIVSTIFVFFRENPDGRYQIMADDRTSFMKSQTHLTQTTELDALAATAMRDDRGSFIKSQTQLTTELDALGATARGEGKGTHPYTGSRSRIDDEDDYSSEEQRQMAAKEGGFNEHYAAVPPRSQGNDGTVSPSPPSFYERRSPAPSYRPGSNGQGQPQQYRQNNSPSPWQRGAGYEH